MLCLSAKKYPHFFSPGAAIEEGTLKPGDRLLEVNSVCVDGMTQSDVVALLRNAPLGSEVKLVVSRHLTTTGNTGAALATTVQASGSSNSPHKDETSQQLVNASPSKKQIQFQFDDESTSHPAAAACAIPPEVNSLENDKEVSALAYPSLGSLRCSTLFDYGKKKPYKRIAHSQDLHSFLKPDVIALCRIKAFTIWQKLCSLNNLCVSFHLYQHFFTAHLIGF